MNRFAAAGPGRFPVCSAHATTRLFSSRRPAAPSRGFTLIEILLALTITMIMMGAVVTLFGVMADSVSGSRSLIEMSDRLRSCRNRIQADLQGATATMKPPLRPESDEGYFEIGEGQYFDGNSGVTGLGFTLFGDTDDYVAFTTRSRGEPFVGKLNGTAVESQNAEVIYFLARSVAGSEAIMDPTTSPPLRLFTLYRRVLLVYPAMGLVSSSTNFYDTNDISVRFQEVQPPVTPRNFNAVANTLGDLTKRENRFSHYGYTTTFPSPFPFTVFVPTTAVPQPSGWPSGTANLVNSNQFLAPLTGAGNIRLGDDILMTNVLAFDVQVYDPGAPVYPYPATGTPTMMLEPRDTGYQSQLTASPAITPATFGAYADLGWGQSYAASGTNPVPLFNLVPVTRSGIPAVRTATSPYVYDTWSLHYENDGLPQMGAYGTDKGANGLDDSNDGVVDDLTEFDTMPPYAGQLRGVRILVRVYDPSSRQIREITVTQDFLSD